MHFFCDISAFFCDISAFVCDISAFVCDKKGELPLPRIVCLTLKAV